MLTLSYIIEFLIEEKLIVKHSDLYLFGSSRCMFSCQLSEKLNKGLNPEYKSVFIFRLDEEKKTLTVTDCRPPHYSYMIYNADLERFFN